MCLVLKMATIRRRTLNRDTTIYENSREKTETYSEKVELVTNLVDLFAPAIKEVQMAVGGCGLNPLNPLDHG